MNAQWAGAGQTAVGTKTNRNVDRWTCAGATTSRDEATPRERGRPARTTLAQAHPSPPPSSTGNGARTLLRASPWGSRRQDGWLPHRRESERHATGEDAGETPALPEGRLLPSFLLREEAPPLPIRQCRPASRAFVVLRVSSVKHPIVNKGEPRMHTNRHEDPWTCLAATTSREEAPPGSAGVPPAQHWHSLTPLSHPARPATAPRFRFSPAHAVPAGRTVGCHIAGNRSGTQRERMRARRPRSRRGASSHPSRSARRHCPCRCGSAVPLRVPSLSFFRWSQARTS